MLSEFLQLHPFQYIAKVSFTSTHIHRAVHLRFETAPSMQHSAVVERNQVASLQPKLRTSGGQRKESKKKPNILGVRKGDWY